MDVASVVKLAVENGVTLVVIGYFMWKETKSEDYERLERKEFTQCVKGFTDSVNNMTEVVRNITTTKKGE